MACLTGATVINEELGDDMDLITVDCLGKADKAVTNDKNTVITTLDIGVNLKERIKNVKKALKKEKRPFIKGKIQDRLAMLSGKVGVV